MDFFSSFQVVWDKLGGIYIAASAPDFKVQDKKLIDWYRRQIKNLNIEVKYNTEIKDLSKIEADEIVIATGSTARKLKLPGFEKAIEAVDYLLENKEVGQTVAVVGGGLSGCEIAYDLHLKGKTPIIVEALNDLMVSNSLSLANTSYLRDYFKTNKVDVYLESKCKEYTRGRIVVVGKDGTEKKWADNI